MTLEQRRKKDSPVKLVSSRNLLIIKYDSVGAISCDARVYMIYENYKAYPVYIIRYKVLTISVTRDSFFLSCFHIMDELFRVYILPFFSLLGLW